MVAGLVASSSAFTSGKERALPRTSSPWRSSASSRTGIDTARYFPHSNPANAQTRCSVLVASVSAVSLREEIHRGVFDPAPPPGSTNSCQGPRDSDRGPAPAPRARLSSLRRLHSVHRSPRRQGSHSDELTKRPDHCRRHRIPVPLRAVPLRETVRDGRRIRVGRRRGRTARGRFFTDAEPGDLCGHDGVITRILLPGQRRIDPEERPIEHGGTRRAGGPADSGPLITAADRELPRNGVLMLRQHSDREPTGITQEGDRPSRYARH